MADNVTLPGAGTSIATDDVGGVQYQRIKLDVGGDGVAVPVVQTVGSVPTVGYQGKANGNITAQNTTPGGTATAGSAVELALQDASTLTIQVTGTYTGALSVQGTVDGTNWVTLGGSPFLNVNTGGFLATITSGLQSIFQVDVGGLLRARITALGGVTGTAAVTLSGNDAASMMALDAALPPGSNAIGSVTVASGSVTQTPVTPSTTFVNSAAGGNPTVVKASAGTLWSIVCSNTNAATRYLKFYNQSTTPTVGSGTPVLTIAIPTNGTVTVTGGANGIRFGTGIAFTTTANAIDADTNGVLSNEMKVAVTFT